MLQPFKNAAVKPKPDSPICNSIYIAIIAITATIPAKRLPFSTFSWPILSAPLFVVSELESLPWVNPPVPESLLPESVDPVPESLVDVLAESMAEALDEGEE